MCWFFLQLYFSNFFVTNTTTDISGGQRVRGARPLCFVSARQCVRASRLCRSVVQVGCASRLRKSASRLCKSAAQVGCADRVQRPTCRWCKSNNKIDHPTRTRPLPSRLCFLLKPTFSELSRSVEFSGNCHSKVKPPATGGGPQCSV